jgi:hypothetical protein
MIFFMRKLEHKERQQATMRSCDDCRSWNRSSQIVEEIVLLKTSGA